MIRGLLQKLNLLPFYRRFKNPKFYKKYKNIETHTHNIEGHEVSFNTVDDFSKRWFFLRNKGQVHEPAVTALLVEYLEKSKCFLDVGANLGYYSCLAGVILKNHKIYSFEMDDNALHLLKENVKLNKLTNVKINHNAVSNKSETLKIPSLHSANPGLKIKSKNEQLSNFKEVQSVSIDEYCKTHNLTPDLLKIDVEGAEAMVMEGMVNTLKEFKPTLFLEIHPEKLLTFDSSPNVIVEKLLELNYEIFELTEHREKELNLLKVTSETRFNKNTMLLVKPMDN